MDEQVIIEVEAAECAECGGRVWDVYRDRNPMSTHGKKPAAKKAARELAEGFQSDGRRVAFKYPEGSRTVTEEYEPDEQAELTGADEDTHGVADDDDGAPEAGYRG